LPNRVKYGFPSSYDLIKNTPERRYLNFYL
jgi:hypothetical protein